MLFYVMPTSYLQVECAISLYLMMLSQPHKLYSIKWENIHSCE